MKKYSINYNEIKDGAAELVEPYVPTAPPIGCDRSKLDKDTELIEPYVPIPEPIDCDNFKLDSGTELFFDLDKLVKKSSSGRSCIFHDDKRLIKFFSYPDNARREIDILNKVPRRVTNINLVLAYNFEKKFIIYKYYDNINLENINSEAVSNHNHKNIIDFIISVIQGLNELHSVHFVHGDASISNLKYDKDSESYVFIDTETLRKIDKDKDDNLKWIDIIDFIRHLDCESNKLKYLKYITTIVRNKSEVINKLDESYLEKFHDLENFLFTLEDTSFNLKDILTDSIAPTTLSES